jgi:hypothetical protein
MNAPNRQPVNGPHFPWYEAIDLPGAGQMQHLRWLIESRPMLDRVPDQSLITAALGTNDRIQATRGKDYLFVYSAQGKPFTVNMGKISGKEVTASWYDPRTGETKEAGRFVNTGQKLFTPPSSGYGQDWVLLADDATKNYPKPAKK